MPLNLDVNSNIDLLFEKLEKFIKSETVIGQPMNVGDTTLIPVINVSFGLGSGGGDGKDQSGNLGTGGGAGIGARVFPTAILVIKGDKIDVVPIKKFGGMEKLLEMVPDLVEKINMKKENKEDIKEDKKEE